MDLTATRTGGLLPVDDVLRVAADGSWAYTNRRNEASLKIQYPDPEQLDTPEFTWRAPSESGTLSDEHLDRLLGLLASPDLHPRPGGRW